MSGSRKSVAYTANDGESYCITCDESNLEMIMGAQVPASGAFMRPPQGLEIRKVRVKNQDGTISRLIPVLTEVRFAAINGGTPFTLASVDSDVGVPVRISQKIAERIRRQPSDFDSGRQDGDAA